LPRRDLRAVNVRTCFKAAEPAGQNEEIPLEGFSEEGVEKWV